MITTAADFKLWAAARELDLSASTDLAIEGALEGATVTLEGFCHRTFKPIEDAVEYAVSSGGKYLSIPDFATVTKVLDNGIELSTSVYRVLPLNKHPKNLIQAVGTHEFGRGSEYEIQGTRGFAPVLPSNVIEGVYLCACVSLFSGGGMLMTSVSVQGMTVNLANVAEREAALRSLLGSIVRV